MTEEQQRIRIAELRGWTEIVRINSGKFGGLRGINPKGEKMIVPFYTRNLNDIFEFLQYAFHNIMNSDEVEEFGKLFQSSHPHAVFSNDDGVDYYDIGMALVDLKADVLCKNILKVLGEWKD